MRSTARKIATAAVIASVGGQSLAEDGFYYRQRMGEGAAADAARPLPPTPLGNTVQGNGDLVLYAASNARARPGVDFRFPLSAMNATGAVAWSSVANALPAGLYVNQAGFLSGSPSALGDYSGIVVAGRDAAGKIGTTQPFTVSVVDRPSIVVQSLSVASGVATEILPRTANVLGSQTWTISGTLPQGLSFDSGTGRIAGTTDQAGTYGGLVVSVVDSDGASGTSAPFSLTVTSTMLVGGIQPNYAARLNSAFQGVQPSLTGTTNPVRWSIASGTLPAGLSFNSGSGAIGGTPTTRGTASGIVLRATDTVTGASVSSPTFAVAVGTAPVVTLDRTAFFARINRSLVVAPTVSGLLGNARWFLDGGTVPGGLSLNASYGSLSGNLSPAAAGRFDGLSLRVVDLYDGSSASSPAFSVSGLGQPVLAGIPGTAAEINIPYALPAPSAANLIGTPKWSLSGELPQGLSFDPSTGSISGTPTTVSPSRQLQVVVTDLYDGASSDPVAFSLVVVPKGMLTVAGVGTSYKAYVGRAFALRPGVAGATGSVSWRAPYMPSWAVLDEASGTVTGTPQAPEPSGSLQITARDAADKTATSPVFTLDAIRPVSLAYNQSVVSIGKAFSLTPQVSDAQGAVRFGVLSGKVPEGISFDPATGTFSGTAFTQGIYPFQVTATDTAVTSNPASLGLQVVPAAWSAAMPGTPAGQPNYPFSAIPTSGGFSGPVTWSLVTGSLPSWATLDGSTGAITGTPPGVSYTGPFVLEAASAVGERARTGTFYVSIVRDPILSANIDPATGYVGAALRMVATSANSQGSIRWAVTSGTLPDGVSLDRDAGILSGVPTVAGRTDGLVLTATDSTGATAATKPFALTVGDSPVSLSAVPDPIAARLGVPVDTKDMGVYGATGGRAFSVAQGSLPNWATLNPATGRITGTPAGIPALGTTSGLRLQVVDGMGFSRLSNPFSVSVTRSDLAVRPAAVRTHRNVAYTSPASSAGNALGALSWQSTALPAGLGIAPSTGAVTGTATDVVGVTIPTFTATDAYDGAVGTAQARVEVLGPPTIGVPSSYRARQGYGFSANPYPDSYVAPLRWSLTSGTLPAGLGLDASTGAISGTPTATGTVTGLTLGVVDGQGVAGSSPSFAFTVSDHVEASMLKGYYPGRVGVGFGSDVPIVSGAVGTVSFGLGSGTLPDGLSVNPATGAIGGTPTVAGTFPVTIAVTDASNVTVQTPSFSVAIGPAPVVTMADQTVRVGAPFKAAPTAVNVGYGENRNPVWSINGTLPPWASFDPLSGTIQGTPDAVGSYPGLAMTIVDGQGAVGSATFALTVTPGLSVTGIQAGYPGRVGQALSPDVRPVPGNAKGTLTWSSGSLPAGLTLSGSTGAVTGAPSTGFNGTSRIVVTDDSDKAALNVPLTFAIAPKLQIPAAAGLTVHVGDTAASSAPPVVGQRGSSLSWTSIGAALPAWATLDAATGIVTARNAQLPSATGLVLQADDGLDHATAATPAFGLTVVPAPTVTNVATSYTARYGFSYSTSPPTLSNAIGAVTWSLYSGTLPSWAHLNADGTISGLYPDAVAVVPNISLLGTDATGANARSVAFSLGVYAQPSVSVASVSSATGKVRVGDAYAVGAKAQGIVGTTRWSYALRNGATAMVPGISVPDPTTGTLSGTVAGEGATAFAMRAEDSTDGTAAFSDPIYLTAKGALALGAVQNVSVHANTRFVTTTAPVASGVVSPGTETYALSPAVPQGMNAFGYSGKGVLSGVPTAASGPTTYTITATDPWDGRTATTQFVVTVLDAIAFTAQPVSVTGIAGQVLSTAVPGIRNASGSVAYAVAKSGTDVSDTFPSLCPGLAFSRTTGIVSGTPADVCTVPGLVLSVKDAEGSTAYSSQFTVTARSPLAVAQQPNSPTVFKGSSATVTAKVSGSSGALTWTLLDQNGATSGVPTWLTKTDCTGTTCTLTAAPPKGISSGAYPTTGGYKLAVADASGSTATTNAFVVNATQVAVTTAVSTTSYNARVGMTVTTGAASGTAGGTAPYAYSVVTVSGTEPATKPTASATGAVTFTPSVTGTWTYKLRATSADDATNFGDSAPVAVTVTDGIALSVADMTIHAYSKGYQQGTVGASAKGTVTGNKGAVTYAVSNQLGYVSQNAAGAFGSSKNAAAVVGTSSYTLTAADSDGTKASAGGNVVVMPIPSVASRSIYIRKGVAFSSPAASYANAIGTVSWGHSYGPIHNTSSVNNTYAASGCYQGALPAGVSIDAATGSYKGTLTATNANANGTSFSGSAPYCFNGIDAADGADAGSWTYVYAANAPLTLAGIPAAVTVSRGVSYDATLTVAGNVNANPTVTVTGTVPAGLAITRTATTVNVKGTPTGTDGASLTVSVTDPWDGTAVSQTVTFTGSEGLIVSTPANSTTRVTGLIPATPGASGGSGTYTWALLSGALPSGVTIDGPTGTFKGRPTAVMAATSYRLRATDASTGAMGDTQAFTVAVTSGAVAVTNPVAGSSLRFHVNATKQIQATSTGATNPTYLTQYNGTGPAWPNWLTLSPSGLVTASPTATTVAVSYNLFAVDGVDSAYGQNGFTVTPIAAMAYATQPTSVAAITGSTYTGAASAVSNPIGSVSYALKSGGLDISATLGSYCAGLSFSTVDASITGKPTDTCSLVGANVVATDAWDASTVTSNGINITVTASSIAVTGTPTQVRATKAFTGNATTSLSSPTWSSSSSPAGLSASVSGTVLSSTAPSPAARTDYALTMTAKQGSTYSLTAAPVTVTVFPKLTMTMAAIASTAGSTLNLSPGGNAATARIGTLAYTLTANGTTSNSALSACGIAFDPATGVLSSQALKMCSVTSVTIAVADDGGGTATLTDTASATFAITVTSPFAFSSQPYSYTVAQNTSTTTVANIGGTPVGSLSWQIVDVANAANPIPAWLAMTNCTNASCTVTASPADTDATGTYPSATGNYRLVATDANGTSVNSGNFNVTVVGTQSLSNTRPAYAWVTNGQPGACDVGVYGCGQANVGDYWPNGGGYLYAYNVAGTNFQYQWAQPVTVTQVTITLQPGTYCGRNGGENSYFFMEAYNETSKSWGTIWGKGLGPYMDYSRTYTENLSGPVTAKRFRVNMSCSNPNGGDSWGKWRLGDSNGFAP